MTKRRLATWSGVIFGTLLALTINVTLAHASDSDWVKEEFHQTYPLTANGRIEVSNINGAVHIAVWDQNQVKVDAVKRADNEEGLKETEIKVDPRPDSISIETKYHQNDDGWRNHHGAIVEYTITVPRKASLDEIKLINGPLDVTGVLGRVHASCINGKLMAHGLASDVELSTVNGPMDISFQQLSAGDLHLQSVNGPVRLTLPSDAKVSIEANTVHGRISNDFGLHVSDHRIVGHDMRGQLGGGGTHIQLNNVNGPIEIFHANDGHAMSPATSDSGDDSGI